MRTLTASVFALSGLLAACAVDDPAPTLSDVSSQADELVGIVDRTAALEGALDHDLAPIGDPIALDSAPGGFYMEFDGREISNADDGTAGNTAEYSNFVAGSLAVIAADVVTAATVIPPALAIGVTAQGTITQLEPNVWQAENTVNLGGTDVTGTFTVAWVGVGWLAEMRITGGEYDHELWFNGFLAYGGGLGWWDFYSNGQVAGVVEWIGDGQGNAQFGIGVVAGQYAGNYMSYTFTDDGTARVDAHDEGRAEDAWVQVNPDQTGEVRLPDYNGGAVACWDASFMNAACE